MVLSGRDGSIELMHDLDAALMVRWSSAPGCHGRVRCPAPTRSDRA